MYEEDDSEDFMQRKPNTLHVWGNDKTMNLNSLLLTNIQSSHYFKVNLFGLKTYHEVVDEIYYNVGHMEPWEKGSRKASQSGMCGGVRGVGTGGIVSTAFSCLYKMFTLRLTRKQINGLLNHCDSPYIRGVGFLYLRYTQPPADLYGWFEPYLEDEEIIDVRAGGGEEVTMGQMCRRMLSKLDWYGTLFPRIPVPIEMKIQRLLKERFPEAPSNPVRAPPAPRDAPEQDGPRWPRDRPDPSPAANRDIAEEIAMEKERIRREREAEYRRSPELSRRPQSGREEGSSRPGGGSQDRVLDRHARSRSRETKRHSSRSKEFRQHRSRSKESRRRRSRSKESRRRRSRSKESRRRRSRSRESRRHRSKERRHHRSRSRESRRRRSRERHANGSTR